MPQYRLLSIVSNYIYIHTCSIVLFGSDRTQNSHTSARPSFGDSASPAAMLLKITALNIMVPEHSQSRCMRTLLVRLVTADVVHLQVQIHQRHRLFELQIARSQAHARGVPPWRNHRWRESKREDHLRPDLVFGPDPPRVGASSNTQRHVRMCAMQEVNIYQPPCMKSSGHWQTQAKRGRWCCFFEYMTGLSPF